mgnify:CR=1 FL=1
MPDHFRQDFIRFVVEKEVLRFGEFKTKAGRLSPYFFNAGLFDDGAKLSGLQRIVENDAEGDNSDNGTSPDDLA